MRAELLKFHEKYYSSDMMTLCLSGKQDVRTLEKWVLMYFTSVPRRGGGGRPEAGWWGKVPPYAEAAGNMLEVVPVGQARRLTLEWPLWVESPLQREALLTTKPEIIVSHLIGHEGKGAYVYMIDALQRAVSLHHSCYYQHYTRVLMQPLKSLTCWYHQYDLFF